MRMRHLRLSLLFPLLMGTACAADEFVFGYYPGRGAPYVIGGTDGQLDSGILKDLGNALAAEIGLAPVFRFTSRARIPVELEQGQIHAMCSGNPMWYAEPDRFHWSEPLFTEENRLLIARQEPDVADTRQLIGKRLGVFTNYQYPEFAAYFLDGRIIRDDSSSMELVLRKLQLRRVAAVLSSNIELYYQLRQPALAKDYKLASMLVSKRDIHCAFSKNAPVPPAQLDQAIHKLKSNGTIQAILARYR